MGCIKDARTRAAHFSACFDFNLATGASNVIRSRVKTFCFFGSREWGAELWQENSDSIWRCMVKTANARIGQVIPDRLGTVYDETDAASLS